MESSDREKALLAYARKLTLTPSEMNRTDVQHLLDCGLNEKGVLQANLVTGYFNYVNRLADGLGVPLENYWVEE